MTEVNQETLITALDQALLAEVRTISSVLRQAGFDSWVVGGCVRDVALGLLNPEQPRKTGDFDLATSAEPEQVQALFRKVIPTGIKHGTVTVVLSKQHFEVTTLRGERGHTDGRRPDEVFFVNDITADLARRDFTVNAMAYSVEDRTLHDPFSGLSDLVAGKLRAVGDAQARFLEDGLRVLRCARFCATLNFEIESTTAAAIVPSLSSFKKVAQERVQQEWWKALSSRHPGQFLNAILEHGLLAITAPELFTDRDSLLPSAVAAQLLDQAPRDPIYRLALLVVAGSAKKENTAARLQVAAYNAQALGARLKLSREQQHELLRLAQHHVLPDSLLTDPHPALARRYLVQVGREHLESILRMQRDVAAADHLRTDHAALQAAAQQVIEAEAASDAAVHLKELKLNGQDLIELGVPKGRTLGEVLSALLEVVLDDPAQNEREALKAHALRLLAPPQA